MDRLPFRILVVDDDPSTNRNIEKMLLKAGYITRAAYDSMEALREIDSHTFDLIVLDIIMPDLTGKLSERAGVDVLKQIRMRQLYMPVIMLSAGNNAVEMDRESKEYGAYKYLIKGEISPHTFIKTIQEAIDSQVN